MSESSSSRSTSISRVSRRATPGSRNPFLTPLGNRLANANNLPPQLTPRGRHTPPHMSNPHRNDGRQLQLLPNPFEEYFEANTPDNPMHTSTPRPTLPPPDPYESFVIREKSIAGVQSWPANLLLSLNANNWLEWSRKLMTSLQSVQLDEYPLSLVKCPNPRVDPITQQTWRGNDRMILGYMRSHMQASETQVIAHCNTSAEAYDML